MIDARRSVRIGIVLVAAALCAAAGWASTSWGQDAPASGTVMAAGAPAPAGDAVAEPKEPKEPKRITLWTTIASGGVIGFLIILLSMVVTALVIEHFLTIRRDHLVPDALAFDVEAMLKEKKVKQAQELCAQDGSFLGNVLGAGLGQVGAMFGYFDMQSAMQETSEREVSKLYRKLEYLSFIAAASPMLGLLGTVTGMIRAFNKIAATEGAAVPSQLAGGISEALVTTCLGLVVAIPAMFFVSMFRNRVDSLVAEAETLVERLMARFRQGSS